jgi:hypothetical protein
MNIILASSVLCLQATAVGILWDNPVSMAQRFAGMTAMQFIQPPIRQATTQSALASACLRVRNYSRAVLQYTLPWGCTSLQGQELKGMGSGCD